MAIRANQLTNFKGEPYATINQVDAKIQGSLSEFGKALMTVKPFTWEVDSMMNGDSSSIEGITVPINSKYIIVPAIVFNVFNASTGITYGNINYTQDGKTLIIFEDWKDEMFEGEKTFIAYGLVLNNGNPISVLESSTITK